jgi:DNA gyrase subunit A
VFKGRDSTGVRGVRLGADDSVVSMSVIRHFEAEPWERAAFLKRYRAEMGADIEEEAADSEDEPAGDGFLSDDRYQEMLGAQERILTITASGLGKLSSSHDYPVRGRGGQGVKAISQGPRGGQLVACFPVESGDQIMLATSTGQSIRCPVDGISFRSRSAGGVKVFDTGQGEEVVSVARIAEQGEDEGEPDAE